MTNFLGYSHYRGITKRQTNIVDIVIVLDGSESVRRCDFSKAKEALKHVMDTLNNPKSDSKFAAVTFSTTAAVNFRFLPYSLAASKIMTISQPYSSTNTQAGLAEAKKLFDDPNSGTLFISIRAVKTYACIMQSLNTAVWRGAWAQRVDYSDNPLLRTKSTSPAKL